MRCLLVRISYTVVYEARGDFGFKGRRKRRDLPACWDVQAGTQYGSSRIVA